MKEINLTFAEINQISMALVAYRSMFKSFSMPLTDSLIEKFVSFKDDDVDQFSNLENYGIKVR